MAHRDDHIASSLLPPELTDHIISFLHGHRKALSACSLVCKSWLPATRHQQFDSLQIKFDQIHDLDRLLRNSPNVRLYITSLSVVFYLIDMVVLKYTTLAGTLRDIFHNLPNLVEVEFAGLYLIPELEMAAFEPIDSEGNVDGNADWYTDPRPSILINRLRLTNSTVSVSSFAGLIALCFRMKELCFERCVLAGLTSTLSPPQKHGWSSFWPPTRLSLQASSSDANHDSFCDLLTLDRNGFKLPSFVTEVQDRSEIPLLTSVIHRLGDSIDHLDLTVNSDASIPQLFRSEADLDLSHCKVLRICCLTFYLREMFVSENQSLRWIHDCLQQLTSPHLETIELTISADPMTDLRALDSECGTRSLDYVDFDTMRELDWDRFDHMFTKERLESLQKVVLVGQGESSGIYGFLDKSHPGLKRIIEFRKKGGH